LFQQYAAKYVGISRGIPLSNSNQLWGLLWGIFVFGELHGRSSSTYAQVVGGSLLMMLGVGAIAFSSAQSEEQSRWKEAAQREGPRSPRLRRPLRHRQGPNGGRPAPRQSPPPPHRLGRPPRPPPPRRLRRLRRDGARPATLAQLVPRRALNRRAPRSPFHLRP